MSNQLTVDDVEIKIGIVSNSNGIISYHTQVSVSGGDFQRFYYALPESEARQIIEAERGIKPHLRRAVLDRLDQLEANW